MNQWIAAGHINTEEYGLISRNEKWVNASGVLVRDVTQSWGVTSYKDARRIPSSPGSFLLPDGSRWRRAGSYDRTGVRLSFNNGFIRVYPPGWGGGYYEWTGCDNGGYNPNDWSYPTPDLSSERNQSIVECINRLTDRQANIGQYLAESLEAAEMLADTYIGFLKIYHGLRRGRLPRGLTAKDALNLDLQLKYGWRPLASDLFEMYRLAKEGLTTRPLIFHASREIKTQRTIPWNAVYGRVGNASVNSSVKTKLYAMVSGSFTDALNRIGLTNPVQIAWELVPYSFVFDWAMPIGSFLQTLTASAGLDFLGGFTTTYHKGKYTTDLLNVGSASADYYSMVREGHWTLPSAFGTYWPYAVRLPFNKAKVAAIAQLIEQRNFK